jgi:predicted DNA-binding transcriptional regulator YafY
MQRRVHIDELVEEFGVNRRTIYRDIKRLDFFPLELQNGYIVVPDGFSIEHSNLDEDELLVTELAFNSIDGMDEKVRKKVDAIRAKLSTPLFFTPYGVKAQEFEHIDMDSTLLNTIEDAIAKRNVATVKNKNGILSVVEPYKVMAFDGFWYLLAKDRADGKVKTYLVASIESFRVSLERYTTSEIDIDKVLENVHTAWFEDGNSFEVEVEVASEIAHFFRLKKHLSSQKIVQEYQDGTLIVTFEVSSDEDVDNLIKAWIPHMKILKPLRLKEKIKQDIALYLQSLS